MNVLTMIKEAEALLRAEGIEAKEVVLNPQLFRTLKGELRAGYNATIPTTADKATFPGSSITLGEIVVSCKMHVPGFIMEVLE